MSSSLILPSKTPNPKTKGKARPINRIRLTREAHERLEATQAAAAAAATAESALTQANEASAKRPSSNNSKCPNKKCPKPNVVDGTCRTCGRVVDDTNIVAEVTFGETLSGAAMVQGSNLGADQAGPRAGFRRGGISDEREKSIREAKYLMQGYAQQLNIGENIVDMGVQAFKLASSANFIQGRTLATVAAVCLYAACRNDPPCKIMLIDLADLVQVNVFKLGRTFKNLNDAVPLCNEGLPPVFPEDLIYRFASRLEFGPTTGRVAEDAVRLVKRMSRDWMAIGRRPSGICGACLLMAARMHNFRRTIREVVYIVKVTNHTIQLRLDEFAATETSQMTVEDFLTQDFLESSHDPPAFYRTTDEYKQREEQRRRERLAKSKKRMRSETDDGENERSDGQTAAEAAGASASSPPKAGGGADLSSAPQIVYRRDADGFIIPPLPSQIDEIKQKELEGLLDPALFEQEDNSQDDLDDLDGLAKEHGYEGDGQDEDGAEPSTLSNTTKPVVNEGEDENAAKEAPRRGPSKKPQLPVDEDWVEDEEQLESAIEEIFNDPHTLEHAVAYGNAEQRARIHAMWALQQQPPKYIPMDAEVGEDEFADDPEVMHCKLTPEESKMKEMLWVNENKDWLRQQQEKIYRRKLEADRPKQVRKRKRKPRIGEGQTEPASSPAEAAISVLKERAWSKRINYDAIRELFELPDKSGPGSEATSRAGTAAPQVDEGSRAQTPREEEPDPDPAQDDYVENYDEEDGGYENGYQENYAGGEYYAPPYDDCQDGYEEDGGGYDTNDGYQ